MAFFVKVKTFNRNGACTTFGTTGTGLFPWLKENTRNISNESQIYMN